MEIGTQYGPQIRFLESIRFHARRPALARNKSFWPRQTGRSNTNSCSLFSGGYPGGVCEECRLRRMGVGATAILATVRSEQCSARRNCCRKDRIAKVGYWKHLDPGGGVLKTPGSGSTGLHAPESRKMQQKTRGSRLREDLPP